MAIPYMDLVASNVRLARAAAELSQEDVAARMRALGFGEWRRQTVGSTEKGRRRLLLAEALGLMVAFETDLETLLYPQKEFVSISLPAGHETVLPAAKIGFGSGRDRESVWDGNRLLLRAQPHDRRMQPVVAAIVTAGRAILVGRRNDGSPPWTFIAGEVEPGEQPEDAAVREVKEEAGLIVSAGHPIGERIHPRTGRIMIYLAAKPANGTSIHVGDEAELAEVRWVSLAEADELLPDMYAPVRDYLAREVGP